MKLSNVMARGGMTEKKAIDYMTRVRNEAYQNGMKVVRIIRDGKVVEQIIGFVPEGKKYAR